MALAAKDNDIPVSPLQTLVLSSRSSPANGQHRQCAAGRATHVSCASPWRRWGRWGAAAVEGRKGELAVGALRRARKGNPGNIGRVVCMHLTSTERKLGQEQTGVAGEAGARICGALEAKGFARCFELRLYLQMMSYRRSVRRLISKRARVNAGPSILHSDVRMAGAFFVYDIYDDMLEWEDKSGSGSRRILRSWPA